MMMTKTPQASRITKPYEDVKKKITGEEENSSSQTQ